MSGANVARDAYEALERGGVEALIEYVHPDFHGVVPPELSAEPDSYEGHEGIRRYFSLFEEDFEDLRFVPEVIFEEAGAVLAPLAMTGQGRGSGVRIEMDVVVVMWLRDGKIARVTAFRDLDEARAALGAGGAQPP